MSLVYAVLLGVVQGLTEFLPVSSSAHLILVRAFFGWDAEQFGMAFDVACHVGTLVAVLVYFRSDIFAMIRAIPRVATVFGPAPDPAAWTALLIVVGTAPAVVVGVAFGGVIEATLRRPEVAGVTLAGVALQQLPTVGSANHLKEVQAALPAEWQRFKAGADAQALPDEEKARVAKRATAWRTGHRLERADRTRCRIVWVRARTCATTGRTTAATSAKTGRIGRVEISIVTMIGITVVGTAMRATGGTTCGTNTRR